MKNNNIEDGILMHLEILQNHIDRIMELILTAGHEASYLMQYKKVDKKFNNAIAHICSFFLSEKFRFENIKEYCKRQIQYYNAFMNDNDQSLINSLSKRLDEQHIELMKLQNELNKYKNENGLHS